MAILYRTIKKASVLFYRVTNFNMILNYSLSELRWYRKKISFLDFRFLNCFSQNMRKVSFFLDLSMYQSTLWTVKDLTDEVLSKNYWWAVINQFFFTSCSKWKKGTLYGDIGFLPNSKLLSLEHEYSEDCSFLKGNIDWYLRNYVMATS